MRAFFQFLAIFELCSAVFAGGAGGISPRRNAADYPEQQSKEGIGLGVALLTPEQVKAGFATDLNRGFLVIEIGVYPEAGKVVNLSHGDFVLRSRSKEMLVRPADPKAIAVSLQRASSSDRDVTLQPTATIGYESGPGYYDPMTGTRRGGGLYTGVGVGVGVGNPGTGASEQDRKTMEAELTDHQLPEGAVSKPISGYLYFPLKDRKKAESFLLEFTSTGEPLLVPIRSDKRGR